MALAAVLLALVAYWCVGLGHVIDAERAALFAREAATRHSAEATAVSAAKAPTPTQAPGYTVHVQWVSQNVTHDDVMRVSRDVRPGDKVPVWLDEQGKLTQAPRTAADATADAVASAVLLWLVALSAVVGALYGLRRLVDRARYRAWDRDLHRLLVDNDGGWATRNT